jgi:O-Antigen ligase
MMDVLDKRNAYGGLQERRGPWLVVVGLTMLFVIGFSVGRLTEVTHRVEMQGLRFITSASPLKVVCVVALGTLACLLLIRYAETALALFFLVGMVKGDPRLASTPVDLTLLVGTIVQTGVMYRVFVKKQALRLPHEYFFYVPLVVMMVLSLTYTPDLSGGLDKVSRFVCLTSIGIIAPFTLFDDLAKVSRFFVSMAVGGLLLALNSFTMLGGEERMVSPSGLNTELGAASAVALIIIWGLIFPRLGLGRRILLYPVLGVLGVALIGSGGRFANVITAICLLIGAVLCRKLFIDLVVAGGLGILVLPFVWIPAASFQYLSSLLHPAQAMGTRDDLMWLGVRMFSEHPILGVGVQGFRYLSPNPLTYNYPHNLFLELGSEMGFMAAFAFVALALCAFWEIAKQLSDPALWGEAVVGTVFLLLIYVFLDAMVSGDINDLRFMWFMFGLPFVLRNVESTCGLGTLARSVASHLLNAKLPAAMQSGGAAPRMS